MGGAGHAGPMLNDAIYLNPSFVSFLPVYSISGNYLFYGGPTNSDGDSDIHGHNVNLSLQDGRSELFQAGAGLTLLEDRKIISIGASKNIVQRFGLGIGGKFIVPNVESPHPIWDSIISMTWVPFDWVQVATVIDNLLESDEGRSRGVFREYILGTKFNVQSLVLLYVDPHWTPHSPEGLLGLEAGLEIPILQDLFIRAGMFRNAAQPFLSNLRSKGYSSGIGWIGPRISADYSFTRVLEPLLATAHQFGVTVSF